MDKDIDMSSLTVKEKCFFSIKYTMTRMTTFRKAKLQKSDGQTNIDKIKSGYAKNMTEYHFKT